MKTLQLMLGLVVTGLAGPAQAVLIEFTDTYTPTSPVALSGTDSIGYSHYITPPGAATNSLETYIDGVLTVGAGYDSAVDTLFSGTLSLFFSGGSNTPPWQNGRFDLYLGGDQHLDNQKFDTVVSVDDTHFDVNLMSSAGGLSVSIQRANASGTVNFTQSVLNLLGDRDERSRAVAVPEPGSFALFSIGVLALGLFGRRRAL